MSGFLTLRSRLLVLALASLTASTVHAQSNWVGSIQGGYSVSLETAESFPAGGAFGSSAFIAWRPYGAVGLGFYFGTRETEVVLLVASTGDFELGPEQNTVTRTALGASIGGDTFVTLLAGVGYRW